MISILKLKRMLGYLKHYYYDYDPSEFGQYGLNVEINKPLPVGGINLVHT